jgi:hypothetical protein
MQRNINKYTYITYVIECRIKIKKSKAIADQSDGAIGEEEDWSS